MTWPTLAYRKYQFRFLNGESTTRKDYSFVDKAPFSGKNYYRLRMMDNDGTFAYSRIRLAEFGNGTLALWPDPATDQTRVKAGIAKSVLRIQIISLTGLVVSERSQLNGFQSDQVLEVKLATGTLSGSSV